MAALKDKKNIWQNAGKIKNVRGYFQKLSQNVRKKKEAKTLLIFSNALVIPPSPNVILSARFLYSNESKKFDKKFTDISYKIFYRNQTPWDRILPC